MVIYSDAQKELVLKYNPNGTPYPSNLDRVPLADRRYKCTSCFTAAILHTALDNGACPVCGDATALIPMCPLDHCHCSHDIVERIEYCPLCGAAVCPECGSHNVLQLSRVTGYIQDVAGFNAGKAQEVKDRVRTNVTC